MTRRRLLCGLLLLSALLACLGGRLCIASRPRVTRARFEQVKTGMSREEVIRTVGGVPGDYSSDGRGSLEALHRSLEKLPATALDPEHRILWKYEYWYVDDGKLQVDFDAADMAVKVSIWKHEPPTLTERIRRWLGL